MPMTDAQIALLLQTLHDIERHLADLAKATQELARLAAQSAVSPSK